MSKVRNGNQKGHKRFRELRRTPFIKCLVHIIINDTLARSLEPVVTECKEHTIHTQTQIVASRKPNMCFVFKKNERSDKIVFYILFKTQRPSDKVF